MNIQNTMRSYHPCSLGAAAKILTKRKHTCSRLLHGGLR